ncbi:unnamed protein product [Psylliodes chrysocephalus]|uniref:HAT C-terminal dimerisation domain-containing protein n=1 Tax=Psylliodes chrysocephalus TaxID=3402493 RepID=A0A9P0CDU3_9CUCU|nr:unnamed protein product [Psylliodes chrysocephala]
MGFRLKVKYELEKQIRTMSEEMYEMTTNSESEANKKSEINILFPEDSGPNNYLSTVEEYNSKILLRKDQNPLTWWKNNSNKYPLLSVLAESGLTGPIRLARFDRTD